MNEIEGLNERVRALEDILQEFSEKASLQPVQSRMIALLPINYFDREPGHPGGDAHPPLERAERRKREAEERRKRHRRERIRAARRDGSYKERLIKEKQRRIEQLLASGNGEEAAAVLEELTKDMKEVAEKSLDHFEDHIDSDGYRIGSRGSCEWHIKPTFEPLGIKLKFECNF